MSSRRCPHARRNGIRPALLRQELNRIPLWRGDHVGVKQLRDDFAQYLYRPRLRDSEVLLEAVRDGTARRQLDADATARPEPRSVDYTDGAAHADHGRVADGISAGGYGTGGSATATPVPAAPRRFHGSVKLDATRSGRDAGKIADEVIAHLTGLVGANVEVTLEIHAEIPDGVPDHVVRTVTENCRPLRFTTFGFEER
ncbi:MAG: hypothetical protein H0V51_07215 [Chloroflexi bacterium]|nr:hypothetical protein [Chloroflexota bacterium]